MIPRLPGEVYDHMNGRRRDVAGDHLNPARRDAMRDRSSSCLGPRCYVRIALTGGLGGQPVRRDRDRSF